MPTVADIRRQYPDLAGLDDGQVVDALHQAFYPDLSRDDVAARLGVKPAAAPIEPSGFLRRAVGDSAVSLLKGAISVPESIVGMADLVSGGRVGQWAQAAGFDPNAAQQVAEGMYSPEQQAADQEVQQAEGLGDTLRAVLRNPSVIAHGALQSLPLMGAGGVVGRGAMALAPRIGAGLAAGIGEGVTTMGSQAEQIRQATPNGLLTPGQAVLGAGSGALTGALGALGNRISKALGIHDIDTMIVGKADPVVTKNFARRLLEGAVSEGLLEELPQSVQEQVAQNLATGQPVGANVAQQAVLGALTGGALGAGANVIGHGKPTTVADEIRQAKLPEQGPLTRAVNAGVEQEAKQAEAMEPVAGQQPLPATSAVEPPPGDNEAPIAPAGPAQVETPNAGEDAGMLEAAPAPEQPAEVAAEPAQPQRATFDTRQAVESYLSEQRRGGSARIGPVVTVELPDGRFSFLRKGEPGFDEASGPAEGDILNAKGAPFATKKAAQLAQKKQPEPDGLAVASVTGGFVLRRKEANDGRPAELAGPAGAGTSADAGGSAGAALDLAAGRPGDDDAAPAVDAAQARTVEPQPAGDGEALTPQPTVAPKPGQPTAAPKPIPLPTEAPRAGKPTVAPRPLNPSGQEVTHEEPFRTADGRFSEAPVEAAPAAPAEPARENALERRARLMRERRAAQGAITAASAGSTAADEEPGATPAAGTVETPPSAPTIVEHVTAKGKTLRGVVRTDLTKDEAKAIDPFTFKRDGGWFIREKHLAAAAPAQESPDATREVPEQGSVQPQREEGSSGGQAAEAGGGDRVQREAPGAEQEPQEVAPPEKAVPAPSLPAVKQQLHVEFGGKRYAVDSIADAQAKWVRFRDTTGEGVSQVGNGVTVFDQDGKPVARVAYNGRAFDANDKVIEEAPKRAVEGGANGTPAVEPPSPSVESAPAPADTSPEPTPPPEPAKEPDHDSTVRGHAPALDHPLAQGLPPDSAVRGARDEGEGDRRADDGGVRGEGGSGQGADDARQDLGDGRGDAELPDRAHGDVGRRGAGVPSDYRPGPGGLTREGSWFDAAARNIDLIELALKIEAEGRPATAEEQARLSKYVGFGAGEIRNNLFPVPPSYARQNDPNRLIWPNLVRDRWKPLAERLEKLPREWQQSVLQSTQYAHYTSEGIVRSTWAALQRFGFTGGKVFEPGMGIGNFAMLMPASVHRTSKFTGIEFDGPTALIARLLSPQQQMLHDDFIKRRLPRDYFDVAIGNPPFSQTKVLGDPDYEKHGFMLHDFFFAKALDRVRPGGLLAFVTSKGTMDKQSDKARRFMAERADLLGAIRLPSTAFEDNAGTSVVTDVLFLRKRKEGEAAGGRAWGAVKTVETKDGPVVINEYFADHPDMVLGQNRISGNVDDRGRRINSNGMGGERYTVVSYDASPAELEAKFAQAVESLPANVYSSMSQEAAQLRRETAKVDFDPKMRREGVIYIADDGTLMRVHAGVGKALDADVKISPKDTAWLKGYVGIREAVQVARAAQAEEGDWKAALADLNRVYDAFVKEHGPVNDFRVQVRKSTDEEGNAVETPIRIFKNRRLFREDYDSAIVTQLESIDDEGRIRKAPFLLDRTIGKPAVREVKTVGDALAVSLDENGHLDLDDVAKRAGLARDEAIDALGSAVYRTPQGEWQLADEYLSGDVRAKLEEAEHAAREDESLRRNVAALKEVQPERLGPSQIGVKLGASWVPAEYVNEFAKEIEAGDVRFDPKTESWQVEGGNLRSQRRAGAEYGTAARSASELLEAALNSRSVVVTRTIDKKPVTDAQATTAAQEAIAKIRAKFKSWIWTDSERAATLVDEYNRRFNNIAPRRFDGSHLTLPGVSLRYKLHPHQLRAIWRQIQTGDTYLAHAVGAGKTIEMIAGGMEQKRLGLIKKPIYAVPNHMLEQFANEFMELYPLANIMVADDENFSAERRKAFVAAATLNAPDAIIITHSAFERIGVKEETVAPIRDEILDDLQDELDDAAKDRGDRVRRSQLEQQIEAVTQRFDSIIGAGKKDSTIKFEDIGADFVYVDEAHAFRKLDFTTNQKIKGIDPNGSRRALDMYVKTRWLGKMRPGRSMVFASGTPVTNTMGELYTIMRFFAPDELDRTGTATFDGWARQYGEVVAALEANAAGRYETVERFAKFDNVPELMSRIRQFMDVLTSEHLGALVKRPDIEGGKPDLITVEPTEALKTYMKQVLVPRLEASRRWKPTKDEPNNPDPVIAITTDGRFAALDPRFFGAKVAPGTPTKLNMMAERVAEEYAATSGNAYTDASGKTEKVRGGTQIVFYNLGFGQQSQKNRGFDARGALTRRLVELGVKREHIAWFDDADTDAKKEAVFKAMRGADKRVLIGSAKKMGTGVNVQKRLTALHYFDPPWFPSDVEQPHGRIIRQGNQNPKARIKWYATKGTYDSTMWQMVARKQRFIDQAFSGDRSLRSMDDLSEASAYEQAAAVASGDPRALQLAGLRQDVDRFERLHAAHANEQINVRSALQSAEWNVAAYQKRIATYGKAFKAIGERYFGFTEGKVGARTYQKQGEFGDALKAAFNRAAADFVLEPFADRTIAKVGPIDLAMTPDAGKGGKPNGNFTLSAAIGGTDIELLSGAGLGADVDAAGLTRRIVNAANSIDGKLQEAKRQLASNETDVVRLRKKLGAPFEHAQDLAEKYAELKRLEEELRTEGEAVQPKIDASGNLVASIAPTLRSGQPVDQVREIVERMTARWVNAPQVEVVATLADAPQAARDAAARMRERGVSGSPEGFFHADKVYLVADRLPRQRDVVRVMLHESVGHYGLRATFGQELGTLLDRMAILNAGKVRAKARAYRLDYDKQSDRRHAAEEVLAEMAQTSPQVGWVRRAVAAIKTWLREHVPGFGKMAFSDAELIRDFIAPAARFVKHGGTPAAAPAQAEVMASLPAALDAGLNNVRDVKLPAGYLVQDLFQSTGKLHWWHKTVGSPYNLAQRSPQFKRVYDAVQNFVGDTSYYATEAADLAPTILPKLESWKDIAKAPLSAADTKALSRPVFEGTLSWARDAQGKPVRIDDLKRQAEGMTTEQKAHALLRAGKVMPAELKRWQATPLDIHDGAVRNRYEREFLRAGVLWSDDELKSLFRLDGRQIRLYREFRAATDKSLTNLAISDMLRFGGKDVAAVRDEALGTNDVDKAAELLRDHLFEAAEADPDRSSVLNDTANKIVEKADRARDLMQRGYAPLSRFGQYSVYVVDKGEQAYFGLFESRPEANRMARRMKALFPDAVIQQGTVSQEEYRLFAGVSPETLELFGEMLGLEAQGSDAASQVFQTYLKLAKNNRSAMKRLIERKGVAGFSEDAGRVLAGFVYSNARQTAGNLHMGEMSEAAEAVSKGQGELKDAAVRLIEYVKNPQEEAQAFRGILFTQYLGGSVASAIVNATQPFAVTFPYLSQFGGIGKAASQMAAAVRDATKDSTGDKALDAALKKAEEEGIVSPQEVHQLMAQARGKGALKSGDGTLAGDTAARVSNATSKLLLAWGKVFGVAEQFNRRVTFIAAYRTALEQGLGDPSAFATKAVAETQFTYNKGNRPRWARGILGATAFTFKTYSVQYLELLGRMWSQGGPEGKRAVLLALAVLFLMGGSDGLPFAQDVEDLIDGLLQHFGYHFSTKAAKRQFFAGILGDGGARFVEHGISGLPGVPIDVSGRMGMGNLIPGTGLALKKQDHTSDVAELAGPAGDFAKRAGQAAGKLLDLEPVEAAKVMSPLASRNWAQAYDMATTGMYRDQGGRKVLDTDGWAVLSKFLGFQPNAVARVQEAAHEAQAMKDSYNVRKAELQDDMAQAVFENDSGAKQRVREAVARWNSNNPATPIALNMAAIVRKVRSMREDKATRIAKTAPKAIRSAVREQLAAGS